MSKLEFKPAWWLPGPHLQTLWPAFISRSVKNIPFEQERLELADGDFLDLTWLGKNQKGPLVILLHGLEGSVNSSYVQGMMQAFYKRNWRAVLMHFRGCSGEPNRLPRSYHSGETSDFNILINILRDRDPKTILSCVGFSLGGNVLLKWLGETGNKNSLTAAVAISVPFELHKAAERIKKGFSKVYQAFFLKTLQKRLEEKFQRHPITHFTLPCFEELKTLREFDDKFTAPLHGFTGVDDYYTRSSSRKYLHNIKTPTLLLQSVDDPFMSPDVIPTAEELSETIELEVTNRGGHVGFVMGKFPWRPQYWLDERVPLFLEQYVMPAKAGIQEKS